MFANFVSPAAASRLLTPAVRLFALIAFALAAFSNASPLRAETAPMHYFEFKADTAELERRLGGEFDLIEVMTATLNVAERRLDALGKGDLPYQLQYTGGETIGLFLRHKDAPRIAKDVFGIGGELSFRLVRREIALRTIVSVPKGYELLFTQDEDRLFLVRIEGGLSGDRLTQAKTAVDPNTDEVVINLQFDSEGAQQFAAMTRANVGKQLAIVLDGKVLSAPMIWEPIVEGAVQISGGFTQEKADTLTIMLRSGALPGSFKLVEQRVLKDLE